MSSLNASDLGTGSGLDNGTSLDTGADLDGQQTLPTGGGVQVPGQQRLGISPSYLDAVNDATRSRFGVIDQVPATDTNPVYRYRDGKAALYRVPADGDQVAAVKGLMRRGLIK
ncbi:MAG: hypothetical protein AAF962_08840 [Actinomycetota bacterium]